jgi:hypothetical protein
MLRSITICTLIKNIIRVTKSKRKKLVACIAHTAETINTYNILVGKLEGKRPRPSRELEDNIKADLNEVRFEGVDWIQLSHGRVDWRTLVNTIINLLVPYKLDNSYQLRKMDSSPWI